MEAIKQVIEAGLEAIKQSGQVNGKLYNDFIFVFNQTFPKTPFNAGCGSCLPDAFYHLQTNYNNKNKPMEQPKNDSQFHIKDNGVPYVDKLGIHVSNDSITDHIAFQMLNISENFAAIFDKIPANWKEQLEEWKAKKGSKKVESESNSSTEVKSDEPKPEETSEVKPETSVPKQQNNFNKKKR